MVALTHPALDRLEKFTEASGQPLENFPQFPLTDNQPVPIIEVDDVTKAATQPKRQARLYFGCLLRQTDTAASSSLLI